VVVEQLQDRQDPLLQDRLKDPVEERWMFGPIIPNTIITILTPLITTIIRFISITTNMPPTTDR